ncbi:hypothetical protein [Tepidimicrobium xylanilyticum]|uniref:hypothetical protein n=1 Tax=Tepidimicrobium xylanilyticum TaxID=1123352 RepID=UPI00295F3A11|nr:hypothetical protein [Tepidimicrobium xylanilyticum]
MSRIVPPNVCNGLVLIGIFILFVLLGMGIVFNLINTLYLVLKHRIIKNTK